MSYVSKNVYSSHATSMLPFSKHRSRDALRAGLVAIRSRQRVSERRSPEQGENRSAQLLQAQAKTRSTRKYLGCKQSRTNFAQNIGKNTTSRNNRPRLIDSRIATISVRWTKISPKITMNKQIYTPILYLEDTTASFKARTMSPKYPGYFDNCTPDHFSERFRIFRRQYFPTYLEYFGKMVPKIFGIFRENGRWLRCSRNI